MADNLLDTAAGTQTTAVLAPVPAPVPVLGITGLRREDVPAKFWDEAAGALRLDALLKSYAELEKRLSQRLVPPAEDAPEEERSRFRRAIGVPESPEDYCIDPKHEMCGPDPEVNAQLHAAGFTPAQAQLVYDLAAERLVPLVAEAASEYEARRQVEKLAQHFGGEERFRRVAQQISAWGSAHLPAEVFKALSGTAEGVLALQAMMAKGEPELMRRAEVDPITDEQGLRLMMRDPRYWRSREPEFVRRVTEGFRRLVKN
jgi:hypothetical protein